MPTEPPTALEKSRHGSREGCKESRQTRASFRASATQSSKNTEAEISRLKEVINQLQKNNRAGEMEVGDEFSASSELRWRINQIEKEKLDLTSKYNKEVTEYEAQVARLRALVERGEAQRQGLEYEVAVARRDAAAQENSAKKKIADLYKENQQLQVLNAELRQRASDLERALEITQQAREEDQKGLQAELHERDRMLLSANAENDQLIAEKSRLEALLQAIEDMVAPTQSSHLKTERNRIKDVLKEQDDTLQELKEKIERVQREKERNAESLRRQTSELSYSTEREERLRRELETALKRVKSLEENVESERAAHLESKFNSEIIQLRIRDLETALSVEKSSQAEALSSLELMKEKFRDVENAYMHERDNAKDTQDKLIQLEKEYFNTKAELIGQLEKERVMSAELSVKLQEQERLQAESHQQVSLAQQRHAAVEEAYGNCIKELEQLVTQYHHQGAPQTQNTEDGKQSLFATIDILRRTLSHYHSSLDQTNIQLQEVLKTQGEVKEENREKEIIISELRRNLQELEARAVCGSDELMRLRASVADAAAAADRWQTEVRTVTQQWETEKERCTLAEKQIKTLNQQHERNCQDKLTFLHSLYQRLVAGCVLVAPPQGLLDSFSWTELCAVLQEHVDALTSDLNAAKQKISCLEGVCESKSTALRDIQRAHEGAVESLSIQLKQREENCVKQREELDKQHTELTNQLRHKAQEWRRQCEQAEDRVGVLEHARFELEQEVARLQKLLGARHRDDASLLAACALLAGCVRALHGQVCELAQQKAVLQECVCVGEDLQREVGTLLQALSDSRVKGPKGNIWAFRRCAIAVLAALRFRALGRRSEVLFRVCPGYRGLPAVSVRSVKLTELRAQRDGVEEEETGDVNSRVLKLLCNSELSVLIHSCTQGIQQELDNTDLRSGSSTPAVLVAAQSSFAKLLEKLVAVEDLGCRGRYGEKGLLARRLGQGLHRLRTNQQIPLSNYTSKSMVASLQQHILGFTQRLHSAEVERRNLRLEVSHLRRAATQSRKEHREPKHTGCVPAGQFEGVLAELSSALQREQQAQALLHDQATQLQKLGLTMELRSGDEQEKEKTLAQAVKSLSETQMELRRKEQSLRSLGKHLTQAQQEKQQLQRSINSAENALRMAAKSKDSLASYMKSVEGSLKEVKDRIVLSRTTSSWDDFTLQLPKMHLDMPVPERILGGPEVAACQSLVSSFMEIYQLACSRLASLEREILSHQTHITALKTELHNACLRENQAFVPVIGSADSETCSVEGEVDSGTPSGPDLTASPKEVTVQTQVIQPNASASVLLKKNRGLKKSRPKSVRK